MQYILSYLNFALAFLQSLPFITVIIQKHIIASHSILRPLKAVSLILEMSLKASSLLPSVVLPSAPLGNRIYEYIFFSFFGRYSP
jgi:hypothetical protein